MMKQFNRLNSAPRGHVAGFGWTREARVMHAPTGRVSSRATRREKGKGIKL